MPSQALGRHVEQDVPTTPVGNRHLLAIDQVISGTAGAPDETAAIVAALTAMRTLPHVDAAAFHEVDRATGRAVLRCVQDLPPDVRTRFGALTIAAAPFHNVLVQRQPIFIDDIRLLGPGAEAVAPFASLAMLPVVASDDIVGALSVYSLRGHDWSHEDQLVLPAAGRELGAAIGRLASDRALSDRRLPLHDLFDSVDELFMVAAADGRILWVNGAMERRLGLGGVDWHRMTFLDFHPAGRRIEAAAAIAGLLETGEGTAHLPLLGHDGEEIEVETSVRWGTWDGRRVLFIVSRERVGRRNGDRGDTSVLQMALDTVTAVAQFHDPTTASHSRRVAEVATLIAGRLDLSEDRLAGLRLAAGLHDVGKVAIPAEVLLRPGRLSSAELTLIRTHPEAGSRIVREASTPWPLAEIILQHHERLDGSGYPRGLRAADICPEARILAVADVFEAMSAARPYRGAHTVEEALHELRAGSGRRYDPDVVDAVEELDRDGRLPGDMSGSPSAIAGTEPTARRPPLDRV